MKRESIKPWMIWGGAFILIYIILTIYSFAYDATYDPHPEYDWDFNGLVPLLITNFPGLLVVFGLFNLLDIKVSTFAANAAFWIIMVSVNLIFYFWFGASIGMVWELLKRIRGSRKKEVGS